ncbi:atherin-like [Pyrgilauda ruficollis]|uniref:atherin-like n=1 Tax=Pyrgilauda ruficollis TaxID=221976 RepID=UPI001B8755CB|nr:atherin-like [Pyrgilauda ruficollis]
MPPAPGLTSQVSCTPGAPPPRSAAPWANSSPANWAALSAARSRAGSGQPSAGAAQPGPRGRGRRLGRAAPRAQQREADAEPAARPPQPSPRHLWARLQEKRGRGGYRHSIPNPEKNFSPPSRPSPESFGVTCGTVRGGARSKCGLGAVLLGAAARDGDNLLRKQEGMEMCNIPGASLASDFPSASL